jgi:glycosyltransferase involved in cell wall biosynthesis
MMKNQIKKILFIIQLPPPVHGASLMNSYVINSEVIRSTYLIEVISLQFVKSIKNVAKFSLVKVFKFFFYGFVIVKKVLTQKPDLVYFTICPTGIAFYRDAFYVVLLKLLNSKIVFHLHGKGIKKNVKKSYFKKYLYTWVFKNTYIICLSELLSEDISEVYSGVPFIVPNGIEVQSKFNGIVNRLNRTVPQILYLSNYIRNKGILVLIEALEILKDQGYQFTARLVGAPADLTIEFLENIITNRNLSELTKIIGPRYADNKFLEFQEADIFVHPTYNDVFGLVNLEAMQFSLPVISTFEGSIPDIVIDNETGFLVEPKNAQMLADKIAILLKNNDLRIKMGNKGYQRFINNYTLNHFENNMIRTFNAILGTN